MKTVVIFGGSGFIGKYIVRRLAQLGYKIIIPYQMPIEESKLRIYGKLGQIIPLKFSKSNKEKIKKIIINSDIIINLKTIWQETKINSYNNSILNFNIEIANLINSSKKNIIFIFFSGLGVKESSKSLRIKKIYESEQHLLKNLKYISIIRPSIVIGEGSQFLKKLIQIIRISLFIPLFGSGKAKIQPVYVDDIARAIVEIIVKKSKEKNIYELCGPVIYNYKSFYKLIFKILRKKRFFINFPFNLSLVFFSMLEKTPINILTKEQLLLFKEDNIQSGKEKNFNYLGISPTNVSEIIKNIHKLD